MKTWLVALSLAFVSSFAVANDEAAKETTTETTSEAPAAEEGKKAE